MQSNEVPSGKNTVKPGVHVEVTDGLAKGKRGIVREAGPLEWDEGTPMWRVRFTDELVRDRILRQDYLRVLP